MHPIFFPVKIQSKQNKLSWVSGSRIFCQTKPGKALLAQGWFDRRFKNHLLLTRGGSKGCNRCPGTSQRFQSKMTWVSGSWIFYQTKPRPLLLVSRIAMYYSAYEHYNSNYNSYLLVIVASKPPWSFTNMRYISW